jgi:hypothetical protein
MSSVLWEKYAEQSMRTCKWPIGNNQTLDFIVYDTNTLWNEFAGLYIFAYLSGEYWHALYVGQTTDFSSRLPSHERWDEAVQKGATHIHALLVPQAANRDKVEKMLIQNLQPPMNQALKWDFWA